MEWQRQQLELRGRPMTTRVAVTKLTGVLAPTRLTGMASLAVVATKNGRKGRVGMDSSRVCLSLENFKLDTKGKGACQHS